MNKELAISILRGDVLGTNEQTHEAVFMAIKALKSEPVRHGHWIKMSDADGIYYACSECGNELTRIESFDPQFDLFPRLKSIDKTNYCPNCGACMIKQGDITTEQGDITTKRLDIPTMDEVNDDK